MLKDEVHCQAGEGPSESVFFPLRSVLVSI